MRADANRCLAIALLLAAPGSVAFGQTGGQPAAGIYTCTDDRGRKLTSDRPIAECSHKEQQLLNRDGSLRTVVPPTLTADERAEKEARERKAAEAKSAQADAVKRDRNLMARFPTEAAHDKARQAALDTVRIAMKATEVRLRDLGAERKPLLNEAEFYVGRTMPAKLKQQLDSNEAATDAQRTAAANQEAELVRINRLFDVELDRLRRLWAGAQPGTLGPMPAAPGNNSSPPTAASGSR